MRFQLLLPITVFLFSHTVAAENYSAQEQQARSTLEEIIPQIDRILGYHPNAQLTVRVVPERELQNGEDALEPLAAVFYRGELLVAVTEDGQFVSPDLAKTLRHEYVHFIVAELSAGRAPAWLDEGLAQILSGAENPRAHQALVDWVSNNGYIELAKLNDTMLVGDSSVVLAAYGESYVAVRTLINQFGISKIRALLQRIATDEPNVAFEHVLGQDMVTFDSEFSVQVALAVKAHE